MTNAPSETEHIAAARERKEALAQAFDGQTVWYQEKHILVHARAEVTTSDWGVNVRLANENGYAVFHGRPVSLSGRWDVLIVGEGRMGAQYAGWSLTTWHPFGDDEVAAVADTRATRSEPGTSEGSNAVE
jgi:hypothetical protein